MLQVGAWILFSLIAGAIIIVSLFELMIWMHL